MAPCGILVAGCLTLGFVPLFCPGEWSRCLHPATIVLLQPVAHFGWCAPQSTQLSLDAKSLVESLDAESAVSPAHSAQSPPCPVPPLLYYLPGGLNLARGQNGDRTPAPSAARCRVGLRPSITTLCRSSSDSNAIAVCCYECALRGLNVGPVHPRHAAALCMAHDANRCSCCCHRRLRRKPRTAVAGGMTAVSTENALAVSHGAVSTENALAELRYLSVCDAHRAAPTIFPVAAWIYCCEARPHTTVHAASSALEVGTASSAAFSSCCLAVGSFVRDLFFVAQSQSAQSLNVILVFCHLNLTSRRCYMTYPMSQH